MAMEVALSGAVLSDLKNYDNAQQGMVYTLISASTVGDRSYRLYYYSSVSTATPDDDNVIENLAIGGRYLKIPTDIKITTTGSGNATYNPSTGILNIPPNSFPSPAIASPIRTLNSNFTINATKSANVAYSISLGVTNPLLAGTSSASVFLEFSTNGGTVWQLVSQAANSSGVSLTVTIAITNIQTSVVSGTIPANALVRLRSTIVGTSTVTFVASHEVVY